MVTFSRAGHYERPKNYPFPNRVGIIVYNNNEHCDLTDIYIKLVNMKQVELHETEDFFYCDEEIIFDLDEARRRFDLGEKIIIEAGDEKPFKLAEIQNTDIVFLFEKKPLHSQFHYPIPHSGYITFKSRWDFEFDIHGKKEGKPFSERYSTSIKADRQVPIYEDAIANKVSIEIDKIVHVQQETALKELSAT